MLTPQKIHQDISAHHGQVLDIFASHPWLIPTLTAMHTLPLIIAIPGFWKSRALNKQLKIEREKTKQLALQQVEKVESVAQAHHCHFPFCPKMHAHGHHSATKD